MTANTYGRQIVVPLTNKSGGSVAAGDVVVIDTTNNDAFTTDTTGGFTGGIGVVQDTIASNAIGRVLIGGYAALVNVNASVTRGQFGKTHTVAKQATGVAARAAGTFCQWLTGGTTPDALVYPVDLAGVALTNPMTTLDDIIVGGASGVPARLGKGTDGQVLTVDPSTHHLVWATPSASGSGGPVQLGHVAASASSTLDFAGLISSTYKKYVLRFLGLVPGTTNTDLWLRVGTGGGPTYDSGSNYTYVGIYDGTGDALSVRAAATQAQIQLLSNLATTAGYSANGDVEIYLPGGTLYPFMVSRLSGVVSGNAYFWQQNAWYLSTTALTSLRVLMSSGNVASGDVYLYGIPT